MKVGGEGQMGADGGYSGPSRRNSWHIKRTCNQTPYAEPPMAWCAASRDAADKYSAFQAAWMQDIKGEPTPYLLTCTMLEQTGLVSTREAKVARLRSHYR